MKRINNMFIKNHCKSFGGIQLILVSNNSKTYNCPVFIMSPILSAVTMCYCYVYLRYISSIYICAILYLQRFCLLYLYVLNSDICIDCIWKIQLQIPWKETLTAFTMTQTNLNLIRQDEFKLNFVYPTKLPLPSAEEI